MITTSHPQQGSHLTRVVHGSRKMIGNRVWIVGALNKESQGISQWAHQAANGTRDKEKEIL